VVAGQTSADPPVSPKPPMAAPIRVVTELRPRRRTQGNHPRGLTPASNSREPASKDESGRSRVDIAARPLLHRSRPAGCVSDRHEPHWYQRRDGTWNCGTCHP
jgi:hypothetical protein